ncbi:hypothetical protein QWY99_07210 [Flavobacterium branchiarum]|uniref:Uncharacterized protein n=1 Tax=Flavobacterium branchiarum TaxID=1114870 RepID=A0ABV5FRH6_9FLAO|nr:hypothetical protein [Flavobacterium branchiarum]MDN3672837.1 hypothetical protein [Flavobacterium branchiarum]
MEIKFISNHFGKATDNYLSGSSFGETVVKEYFKGVIGVGANVAPKILD